MWWALVTDKSAKLKIGMPHFFSYRLIILAVVSYWYHDILKDVMMSLSLWKQWQWSWQSAKGIQMSAQKALNFKMSGWKWHWNDTSLNPFLPSVEPRELTKPFLTPCESAEINQVVLYLLSGSCVWKLRSLWKGRVYLLIGHIGGGGGGWVCDLLVEV